MPLTRPQSTNLFPWYGYLLVGVGHLGVVMLAADPSTRFAFVLAAIGLGMVVWAISRRFSFSKKAVVLSALAFRALAFPLPPTLSDDSYRYIWDGRVQQAGFNPYAHRPSDQVLATLQKGPSYAALNSKDYYSVYPPLSQMVFRWGARVSGEDDQLAYYLIKGVFAGAEAGAVLVLGTLVPAAALMLYAWHPLAVIEGAGQGHTESLMVLFLVCSLWAVGRGRGGWAGAAVAGATWVKLYPILLGPLLLWRFGWRALVGGVVVTVPLLAAYAHPEALVHVKASLDLYVQLFEFNAGPYYAAKAVGRWLTGSDVSKVIGPWFRVISLAAVAGFFLLDAGQARGKAMLSARAVAQATAAVLGLLLIFATTVHPWYLTSVLVLVPLLQVKNWYWLATVSLGTYGLYTGDPYWVWVWVGWGGWLVLTMADGVPKIRRWALGRRTKQKGTLLAPGFAALPPQLEVLDLGSGEGAFGEHIAVRFGARVTLADVVDFNESSLPFAVYDGVTLPFRDDRFDAVVLSFVLHHAADANQVLAEARRVVTHRVFVIESVYRTAAEHWVLDRLDRLVNRMRSGGAMVAQEAHLHFRTAEAWEQVFRANGFEVEYAWESTGWLDRKAVYWLRPV